VVLLFRFLIAIIASLVRPRIDPLGQSAIRFSVLPTDCDLNFHLNAGRLVSFMDVSRIELIGRVRILGKLVRRRWRPVMGGVTVRYRRSILPFQRFLVRSRVVGWDEKWFYIEHIAERNGQQCAIGIARTVIRTRERTATPDEVLELMGLSGTPSPALPEFVEAWRAAENAR
jgi:acyl-CoA thioesterase FadM